MLRKTVIKKQLFDFKKVREKNETKQLLPVNQPDVHHEEKEEEEDIEITEDQEEKMYNLLRNVFNLKEFREGQKKIIKHLVYKKADCFVIFPTGGGKSLTYQLSALLFEKGVSVIVCPLIALMDDQIKNLQNKNILAESFNSSILIKKKEFILNDLNSEFPTIKLLYISPEQISSISFRSVLISLHRRRLLNLFAIDEAHCISSWGNDFRKSYRNLGVIKEIFVDVPILACTGTATKKVKDDIINTLKLNRAKNVTLSFNRKNLYYQIKFIDILESDFIDDLVDEIRKFSNECGIVYCFKKQTCDEVAEELRKKGIKAKSYHSGLSNKTRSNIQQGWNSDDIQVLVATVAFGLGVDKKDVRFVIHHSIPKTIEGYYQESGRAGRDGRQAYCILYYSHQDYQKLEYIIKMQSNSSEKFRCENSNIELTALKKVKEYCESLECRRKYTLRYFDEKFEEKKTKANFKEKNEFCCDFCFDKTQVIKNYQKYKMKLNCQNEKKSFKSTVDETDLNNQNYSLEFEKIEEDNGYSSRKKNKSDEERHSFFLSAKQLQFAKNAKPHGHITADTKKKGLNAILKELEKQEAEAEDKEVCKGGSSFFQSTGFSTSFSQNKKRNFPLRFSGGLFAKKFKFHT